MRERSSKNKKRYGVLVALMIANWAVLVWMVLKVDPQTIKDVVLPETYLPMLAVFFGAVFWLLSIALLSAKKALRWSLGVTLFLYLRILGLGNLVNGTLILAILIVVEYYFSIKLSPEEFKKSKNATITEQNKQDN